MCGGKAWNLEFEPLELGALLCTQVCLAMGVCIFNSFIYSAVFNLTIWRFFIAYVCRNRFTDCFGTVT